MDRREREELPHTEPWLVFDEMVDRAKFATGTTNDVDKPDEGIIDLLEDEGNG